MTTKFDYLLASGAVWVREKTRDEEKHVLFELTAPSDHPYFSPGRRHGHAVFEANTGSSLYYRNAQGAEIQFSGGSLVSFWYDEF